MSHAYSWLIASRKPPSASPKKRAPRIFLRCPRVSIPSCDLEKRSCAYTFRHRVQPCRRASPRPFASALRLELQAPSRACASRLSRDRLAWPARVRDQMRRTRFARMFVREASIALERVATLDGIRTARALLCQRLALRESGAALVRQRRTRNVLALHCASPG